MRGLKFRLGWVGTLGGLVALGVATVVIGAPLVDTQPFSMPSVKTPPTKIWEGPATRRVGIKVRVTQGAVRADAIVGTTTAFFCRASRGVDVLLEGGFDAIQLTGVGMVFPAVGERELRYMDAHTATDRLVGRGVVSFSPQAAPVGGYADVYASDAPRRRLATIRPSGSAIVLRTSDGGAPLLNADAGDWAFAIVGAADRFVLSSAAPAACDWEIHDVEAACGPFTGTAAGANDEVDTVYVDGQCPLSITLTNPGPARVRVTYQLPGQTAVLTDVAPGGTASASGALSKFEWTYVDATPSRSTTVSVSATIQ